MEKFATLQEILNMYCISRKLVRDILRHHKVDSHRNGDEIYINIKDFHKIYTSEYNPALFTIEEQKEHIKPIIENKINKTFFSIFSEPISCRQKLRNMVMTYAE